MIRDAIPGFFPQFSTLQRCLFVLTCIVLWAGTASTALAVPIADQHLIHIRQIENRNSPLGRHAFFNNTSTQSGFANTLPSAFGTDIRAQGSLASGTTGTRYSAMSSESSNGQSFIALFDTLTFSTPGGLPTEIFYRFNFDGTMSNSEPACGFCAFGEARVSVYDITGLGTWLENFDPGGDPTFGTNAPQESSLNIRFGVGTQAFKDNFGGFFDELVVDTNGSPFAFDLSKTGSFTADPSKTYGLELFTSSSATGRGSSDFLSTGAFTFSDLNGASFSSASGVFLSQDGDPAPVPEPSTMLLLGSGLAGLAAWRIKTRKR